MKKRELKIFKKIPTLETDRLVLKAISLNHLHDVYEYASDPTTSKYLLWMPHKNINDTKDYLKYIELLYSKGKFYDWGIHLKSNDKMIGTVGFTTLDHIMNSGSVGYVLNTKYTGKGFASEALKTVINFGFSVLKLERLEARFIIENKASQRVLEKCGFIYGGIEREKMLVKGKYKNIGFSYKLITNA